MGTELEDLLPVLGALAEPGRQSDLRAIADLVGLSPSRVQRVVTRDIGESPKRFEQHVRLDFGAILLASTDARVIDVALAAGFECHEAFTRAFGIRFGASPSAWRRDLTNQLTPDDARVASSISRCDRLYRRPLRRKETAMSYSIEIVELHAVPVLYQTRRVATDEVGAVLAECLPHVFGYAMGNAMAPAGHPFVRQVETSPAFVTIDAGVPLVEAPAEAPPADTEILAGELQAGPAATTIHTGPYEGLGDAYAALDRWFETEGRVRGGAPWEQYLTDPGEVPDPAEWQTQIFWPMG